MIEAKSEKFLHAVDELRCTAHHIVSLEEECKYLQSQLVQRQDVLATMKARREAAFATLEDMVASDVYRSLCDYKEPY